MQIDRMISAFLSGIEGRPRYARNLIGLVEVVPGRKEKFRAFELARKGGGTFHRKNRPRAVQAPEPPGSQGCS
jgi:hypothetical protein